MSITPLTMAVLVVADDLQRYRNRALRGEGNRQPAPIVPVPHVTSRRRNRRRNMEAKLKGVAWISIRLIIMR